METKQGLTLFELALVTAGTAILTRRALARRPTFDFANKVVLITGASRGLGLVLARQLVQEGARVAICARDQDDLRRAQDELRMLGAETLAVKCDVTIKSEVDEMVRVVNSEFGPVDVLVNNAGVIQVGPLEVMTAEDFDNAMKTHFWGPLNTILAVLPGMRERREGRIVNISSIGGKISVPHLVPYSASKFALVGLSQGLRAELLKDGIRVTTVCPGLMRTGSPRNAEFKGRHRAEYAWFSISDALPVTSINAGRAASQILDACRRGQAELIISVQAKLAVIFHGLFPGLTADLLGTVNRVLPGPGGIGARKAKGKDSTSSWSPSWITFLNERAAVMNNEMRR
jgi:NAD(P)-dependent dehydrogenase (short-subunit alcohol dehydrogenase family)